MRPSAALRAARMLQERRIRRLGVLLVLAVGVAGTVRVLPVLVSESRLPDELVGTWDTGDPRYAGRTLRLTRDSIVFDAAGDGVAAYQVRRVTRRVLGPVTEFVQVVYADQDGEAIMGFEYRVARGTIELDNPDDVVWQRRERAGRPR